MNKDIFTKILEDHKELSSLPQAVAEILKVSRDSNSSTQDLSKAIMKDPALTTRVLRVVNSPYYAPAQPITTISKAVITLGSRPIIAMALAASIYNVVSMVKSSVDHKKFWRHSLEAGLAAQAIARAVNYESPEEAFICGLLHDIGIIILDASYKDTYSRIWKLVETGEKLSVVEEEHWGTNHARVGQFIMRQWGMPEVLCDAVGGHHTMFGMEDRHPHQRIILITNLANLISKFKISSVPPPETRVIELKKTIIDNLEISNDDLAEIERNLVSEVVAESGYLEIEIGSLEEMLMQANQVIYEQYMHVENLLLDNIPDELAASMPGNNLSIFNGYLKSISGIMNRRTMILKKALGTGKIKDANGYINETIDDVSKWSESVSLIYDEQKKAYQVKDYFNSQSFSRFKQRIESELLSCEIQVESEESVEV